MIYKEKFLLDHILKNLALPGLIASFLVTCAIIFAIVTGQSLLISASLGVTIGGILGPIIVIYSKTKNKKSMSKRNIEINNVFTSYGNRLAAWIVIVVYLLLINFLIYKFNTGDKLSFDNFIFYLIFSCIITINIYSGVVYYTAWKKYKNSDLK